MSADLQFILGWVKDLFTSLGTGIVLFTVAISIASLFINRK